MLPAKPWQPMLPAKGRQPMQLVSASQSMESESNWLNFTSSQYEIMAADKARTNSYAQALQDAGVPTRLHREPGSLHGFAGSPARADKVLRMAAQEVREALHP